MSFYRIAIIYALVIVQVAAWGILTEHTRGIGLALVNVVLRIVFFGKMMLAYFVEQNIISSDTVKDLSKGGKKLAHHGGVVIALAMFMWYSVQAILGSADVGSLLVSSSILGLFSRLDRKELMKGKLFWGSMQISPSHIWLLFAFVISGALFIRMWTGGVQSYIISLAIGWFVLTVGLLFSGLRWKEVARHTGWGLFGIVTSMLVAWSGAQGAFQRYGEHLAQQKHAANEKTTIVYMPTEQAPDTKKPEEDDGEKDAKEEQQEQAEEDAKEEQQEQAEEDIGTGENKNEDESEVNEEIDKEIEEVSDAKDAIEDEDVLVCDPDECAWEERCVTPPRYASCIESTIDARRCDAGYTEINLQCYQACGRNQCRVGTRCVSLPARAYCSASARTGRRCQSGYEVSGATCVAIVSSEPVVIVEQTPEVDTSTEINLGAFIAPEAQPTLLERYVDQSVSVESSQTEESTSLPGLLERYVDQSLSPLEQLLSGE